MFQLGGQTALKLSKRITDYGVKILGSSYDAMDMAEDRERFSDLLKDLGIPYPKYGAAKTAEEALVVANEVGYPGSCSSFICSWRTANENCD